jgi:hypothetical protein
MKNAESCEPTELFAIWNVSQLGTQQQGMYSDVKYRYEVLIRMVIKSSTVAVT